mmetsp:Transcript_27207/g.37716  ORF Transcript_27207/g.37716 Transcript_27207/m.37716 type:complete len:101 (-) Transcript_27207:357-659(-)
MHAPLLLYLPFTCGSLVQSHHQSSSSSSESSVEFILDLFVHVAEEIDVGHIAHLLLLRPKVEGVPLILPCRVLNKVVKELRLVEARTGVCVPGDDADRLE